MASSDDRSRISSEAIVRFLPQKLRPVLEELPGADEPILPGYRTRVLDGNVLTGNRSSTRGVRHGSTPACRGSRWWSWSRTGADQRPVLCEDAYTQERALSNTFWNVCKPGTCWFSTAITHDGVRLHRGDRGSFVGRQHRTNLPVKPVSKLVKCGETETGRIYEQIVRATDPDTGATSLAAHRATPLTKDARWREDNWALDQFARDNGAVAIAEIYGQRWTIETQFQFLMVALHCGFQGWESQRRPCSRSRCRWWPAAAPWWHQRRSERPTVRKPSGSVRILSGGRGRGREHRDAKYLPAEKWKGWRELGAKEMASSTLDRWKGEHGGAAPKSTRAEEASGQEAGLQQKTQTLLDLPPH